MPVFAFSVVVAWSLGGGRLVDFGTKGEVLWIDLESLSILERILHQITKGEVLRIDLESLTILERTVHH